MSPDGGRRTLTLHVGLPKVASTWLQTVILPAVSTASWAVPPWKATADPRSDAGVLLQSLLTGTADAFQVNEVLARCGDLILSSETFLLMPARAPGTEFRDPRESIAYLARVCPPGTRIVIFIRDAEEIVESAYTEYVRMGGNLARIRWRRRLAHPWLTRQNEITQALQQAFRNVHVLQYREILEDPESFIGRLSSALGLEGEWLPVELAEIRSNRSPSPARRWAARQLNRLQRSHLHPGATVNFPWLRPIALRIMTK